jgi:ABC-type transport system substrate-binding protein
MVELDEAKRADLLKKIQLEIMDNSPWANLIQPGLQFAHRTNVEGVIYNPVYQLHLGKVDKK